MDRAGPALKTLRSTAMIRRASAGVVVGRMGAESCWRACECDRFQPPCSQSRVPTRAEVGAGRPLRCDVGHGGHEVQSQGRGQSVGRQLNDSGAF